MRKTVLKVFSSFEKEQKFINSMNQKGWKLEMIRFGVFTNSFLVSPVNTLPKYVRLMQGAQAT